MVHLKIVVYKSRLTKSAKVAERGEKAAQKASK